MYNTVWFKVGIQGIIFMVLNVYQWIQDNRDEIQNHFESADVKFIDIVEDIRAETDIIIIVDPELFVFKLAVLNEVARKFGIEVREIAQPKQKLSPIHFEMQAWIYCDIKRK